MQDVGRQRNEQDASGCRIELGLLIRRYPIPVLPQGSADLFRALADPEMTFEQLTDMLGDFPAIVARLLAVANSPWSAPASPVLTLEDAIARLGLDVVRSASVALLVSRPFDTQRCDGFDPPRYWCSALLAADAGARLANVLARDAAITPAIARTAGLISNLGLLWMANSTPAGTGRALRRTAAEPGLSVHDALLEECGFGYSHAGAALARAWNMPSFLGAAMAYRLPAEGGRREQACAGLTATANALVSGLLRDVAHGVPTEAAKAEPHGQLRADLRHRLSEYRHLAIDLFRSPATDL